MSANAAIGLWTSSDVAQLIVDTPVTEALRPGWSVTSGTEDITEQVKADLEDLGIDVVLSDAVRKARATGGAGILLMSQDADLSKPWGKTSKLEGLMVFDASELTAGTEYITSLNSRAFGFPAYYNLQPLGLVMESIQRIHHTRVVRVCPRPFTRSSIIVRLGWSQPILETLASVIKDFEIAYSEALGLLPDWAQGSITMTGLLRALTSTDSAGAQAIAARYKLLDASRSLHRPIPLDAGDASSPGEKYERHTTPVSGLPELLDRAAQRLSMASRIPVPILMGQSPSGLGDTGSTATRAWYAYVGTIQCDYVRPTLEAILRVLWGAREPAQWKVEFNPLWAPTSQEEAQTLLTTAQAYDILVKAGAIAPDEVRAKVFPGLAESSESAYSESYRSLVSELNKTKNEVEPK